MSEVHPVYGVVAPEVAPVAAALETLIMEQEPSATVVPYPGYKLISYGVGPKKNSEGVAYVAPQSAWVNLGFYRGAQLPDPEGLLVGSGAALRHVKVRALPLDRAALGALLAAAFAERRAALGR